MQVPAALAKQSWKTNQYLTKLEKGQVENNCLELQYIPIAICNQFSQFQMFLGEKTLIFNQYLQRYFKVFIHR